MGAIANINLKNAAAVEQLYTANQPDRNNVVWYFNRSSISPLGHPRVSAQLILPPYNSTTMADNGRMVRVRFGIYLPQLESVSVTDGGYTAVPRVAYTDSVKMEFLLAERGSTLNRQNLRAAMVDLFTEANIIDMIDNFNGTF